MLRTTKSKGPLKVKLKYLAAYFPLTWPEAYLFTKDDSKKPGDVTQCSSPEVRMCQTVKLNYHNLREEEGAKILGLIQGTDVEVQTGWNHGVATPSLLCHKDTAQVTPSRGILDGSPLLRTFLAIHFVFMT